MTKSIVWMLVIAIVLTGCIRGVIEEETKTTIGAVEEVTEAITEGTSVALVEEVTDAEEITESMVEEDVIISEEEIAFIDQLAGGFFYSGGVESVYSEVRSKAIDRLNERIALLYNHCDQLYMDGVVTYEAYLLKAIENGLTDGRLEEDQLAPMLQEMVVYDTTIESLIEGIYGYQKSLLEQQKGGVAVSAMNNEVFVSTNQLYGAIDGYINYLGKVALYVTYVGVDAEGATSLSAFEPSDETVYGEVLVPLMVEAMMAYEEMGIAFVQIESTDFHYNQAMSYSHINELESLPESIEVTEMVERLEDSDGMRPGMLMVIEGEALLEDQATTTSRIYRPFALDVYATVTEKEPSSMDQALAMAQAPEVHVSDWHNEGLEESIAPNKLKEAIEKRREAQISDRIGFIFQMLNVESPDETGDESPQEDEEGQNPKPFTLEALLAMGGEMMMDAAGCEPQYGFVNEDGVVVPVKIEYDRRNELRDGKYVERTSDELGDFMINEADREALLIKLKNYHSLGDGFSGLSFMAGFNDEKAYNMMIGSFIDMIRKNGDRTNPENMNELIGLLENELEGILGDRKDMFTVRFFDRNMVEVIERFSDWINTSFASEDMLQNRDQLLTMLEDMGYVTKNNSWFTTSSEDTEDEVTNDEVLEEKPSGTLEESVVMEEITYYDDGAIRIIAHYTKDSEDRKTLVGKWQLFGNDGTLIEESNYNDLGQLDGLYTEYYFKTGILKVKMNYVDGLIEGNAYTYHTEGGMASETMYLNGLKHGYYADYVGGGAIRTKGYHTNDLRDGTWTHYHSGPADPPGDYPIYVIEEYNLGLSADKKGYSDGKLSTHTTFINGVWSETYEYDEDGGIKNHFVNEN